MRKNLVFPIILAVIIMTAAILIYYTGQKKNTYSAKELAAIEVREYEGKNLSSINNFRENSIKGPQFVDKDSYKLEIRGLKEDQSFSYDDLVSFLPHYKKVVTLNCVEGWSATILWEGFLVKDLIKRDAVPAGVNTVIFRAYDGYSTSFPLDYIMDNDIIMAYKMNGLELPPERGFPFQLVAESKWGYKWIKWITEIEFTDDENYQGYWESRGYSNGGDLNKSFFSK